MDSYLIKCDLIKIEISIVDAGLIVVNDIPVRCNAVGAPALTINFHND